MKNKIYTLTLCLLLCSCASDPLTNAYVHSAERIEVDNEPERLRVAYLSQELMSTSERQELLQKITDEKIITKWNAAQKSLAAQTSTDLLVGELGSSLGSNVGASVFIASAAFNFLIDGAVDHLSKVYLPEIFQGRRLLTAQDATNALYLYAEQNLKFLADKNNYEISCLKGCESGDRIYYLKPTSENLKDPMLIYSPIGGVVVSTRWKSMVNAEDDVIRDNALGFKAKWRTEGSNGFVTGFYGDPLYLKDGTFDFRANDDGFIWLAARSDLMKTKFGRRLLRQFYANPYIIFGEDNIYPSQVYYDGKTYAYVTTYIDYFLKEKILD